MNNTFAKDDYHKAAVLMRGLILDKISDDIYISDLLENAITNIEIIEHYFHSVDPVISKRCENCGQKLRVKINDNKSEHALDN